MRLSEMTLVDFTKATASEAAAPGGGSIAALAGAQGAGLAAMVCALTLGRKKYAADQELATETKAFMDGLAMKFVGLVDSDTEAFNKVSAALELPKSNDAEKAARAEALQQAFKECTEPPIETMRTALKAIERVEPLVGHTNATAASDLAVSAMCLKTAASAGRVNVLTNVSSISDKEFGKRYHDEAEQIIAEVVKIGDRIIEAVERAITKA